LAWHKALEVADRQPVIARHEALIGAVSAVFRVGLGAVSGGGGCVPKVIDPIVDEPHRAVAEGKLSPAYMEAAKAFSAARMIDVPIYGWPIWCIELHARMSEHVIDSGSASTTGPFYADPSAGAALLAFPLAEHERITRPINDV